MKMQQKDQENGVTPKKHWKPALTQGAKDANSPSVASRSAAFEKNLRDEQQVSNLTVITTIMYSKQLTRKENHKLSLVLPSQRIIITVLNLFAAKNTLILILLQALELFSSI